jgi:hypothetical protein
MADGLASGEIRPRVAAALAFLDEPGLPTEAEAEDASVRLVSLSKETDERRAFASHLATIEKLEAGPAPLDSMVSELNRVAQRIEPVDSAETWAFLKSLSRIRGAHAAKNRFPASRARGSAKSSSRARRRWILPSAALQGEKRESSTSPSRRIASFSKGLFIRRKVSPTSISFSETRAVLSPSCGRLERRACRSASPP